MIDAQGLALASHEAAHAVAVLAVGRELVSVSREGRGGAAHGRTVSVPSLDDPDAVLNAIVILLAGVHVAPTYGGVDVAAAQGMAEETGSDLNEASDRTRLLVASAEFRHRHRIIERALASRPSLTGAEVDALLV